MNYIVETTIENFQSHKKTSICWAPAGQLTILTGPSDSGKTAIIRSEDWINNNKPSGTAFIRVGCTFARVTNKYASGHIVVRERTASKNQYKIYYPGQDQPLILEGFGREEVPLEVQEITGVKPITIGDQVLNLNFSSQLEGPFLGNTVSGPARAKMLGKLAGVEEIDFAGKGVEGDIRNLGQEQNQLTADIESLEAEIAQYNYLPELAEKITKLEKLAELIRTAEERRDKIFKIKQELAVFDQAIRTTNNTLDKLKNLILAEALFETITSNFYRYKEIALIKVQLGNIDFGMKETREIISKYTNLDRAAGLLQQVRENVMRWTTVSSVKQQLGTIDSTIKENQGIVSKYVNIDSASALYQQLLSKALRRASVFSIKQQLDGIDNLMTKANDVINRLAFLAETEVLLEKIKEYLNRMNALIAIKTALDSNAAEMRSHENVIKRTTNIDTCLDLHQQIATRVELYSKIIAIKHELHSLDILIGNQQSIATQAGEKVTKLEELRKQTLIDAKICPVCGMQIQDTSIHCA